VDIAEEGTEVCQPSYLLYTSEDPAIVQSCVSNTTQLAWNGHVYRTLTQGVDKDGATQEVGGEPNNAQNALQQMPSGFWFLQAEDRSSNGPVANVICEHTWNAWRPCSARYCYEGAHYSANCNAEISVKNGNGTHTWRTQPDLGYLTTATAPGYRLSTSLTSWYRLMIRAPCA